MSQAQRQKRKTVSRINFDEDAGFPAKKRTKVDAAASDVNSASTRRKNPGVLGRATGSRMLTVTSVR
jgi:hypothetical protein